MSIGPGVIAVPLVNAPGSQVPSGVPAAEAGNGAGASSHADFQSALKSGATGPAQQVSAQPATAYRPGAMAPRNTLGEQVLDGLEKFGRSVEAMDALGPPPTTAKAATVTASAAKVGAAKAGAATAPSPGAPSKDAAQKPGSGNPVAEMRDIWETGMRHQSQVYATVFNFELIQETSQSMLKSLKSLLTQGGG